MCYAWARILAEQGKSSTFFSKCFFVNHKNMNPIFLQQGSILTEVKKNKTCQLHFFVYHYAQFIKYTYTLLHNFDLLISKRSIVQIYTKPKIRDSLYFFSVFYLNTEKNMDSKSILGVTYTCSNTCTIPVGHTGDHTAYRYSLNLLAFLLKSNTKFLEKYKGSFIFGPAYICLYIALYSIPFNWLCTIWLFFEESYLWPHPSKCQTDCLHIFLRFIRFHWICNMPIF